MELERRSLVTELRFVAGAESKPGVLSGYAAPFNSLSDEIGSASRRFRETIMPGSFRSVLAKGDEVFSFYNHGVAGGFPHAAMPLASTKDGSLRLREEAHGLSFDMDLPDTSQGRDLAVLVPRGTVRGVSIGFKGAKDSWHRDGSGMRVRTIHEFVGLTDVSPTHMPAYAETTLALRSLEAWEGVLESRSLNAAGEMSLEQRQADVRAAVRKLLGDPYGSISSSGWQIVATFDASVVVEQGGKFSSYPVTWVAGAEPTLGDPSPVEQIYRAPDPATASRRRRTRLAEIS